MLGGIGIVLLPIWLIWQMIRSVVWFVPKLRYVQWWEIAIIPVALFVMLLGVIAVSSSPGFWSVLLMLVGCGLFALPFVHRAMDDGA